MPRLDNGTHRSATHGIILLHIIKTKLIESLDDIKQNLSTIAGVNTSMDLNFENVTYVTNGTTMFGNDTVSYVPIGPDPQSYKK